MAAARILIIEDDPSIVAVYRRVLESLGYSAIIASDGAEGLQLAASMAPDLILLDCCLPEVGGIECCRALRSNPQTAAIPMLMVTGLGLVAQRIAGLNAGADDYLTKPFSIGELLARMRALLRRASPATVTSARSAARQASPSQHSAPAPPLSFDPAALRARIGDEEILLTNCEGQLLEYLMRHAGRTCSSELLLREVWGYEPDSADVGLVRWHMRNLRSKIQPQGGRRSYIHTVRGRGYVFRQPD